MTRYVPKTRRRSAFVSMWIDKTIITHGGWSCSTEDEPMWRTSCGDRILHRAGARFIAKALWGLLYEVQTVSLDDYSLGVPCFDNMTCGQEISVLAVVANGLRRKHVPVVPYTAVLGGAISMVFEPLPIV